MTGRRRLADKVVTDRVFPGSFKKQKKAPGQHVYRPCRRKGCVRACTLDGDQLHLSKSEQAYLNHEAQACLLDDRLPFHGARCHPFDPGFGPGCVGAARPCCFARRGGTRSLPHPAQQDLPAPAGRKAPIAVPVQRPGAAGRQHGQLLRFHQAVQGPGGTRTSDDGWVLWSLPWPSSRVSSRVREAVALVST